MLDCDLEVNEFEPQSRYYFHANAFEKGMNSLSYGLNRVTAILQGWLCWFLYLIVIQHLWVV